jgi:hypothetical protein
VKYKNLLATFIEVVVFLFAAFSGFLSNIAPPVYPNISYAVGISSFFVLIILLIISAVAQKKSPSTYRRSWIRAGVVAFIVALPAGLIYPWTLGKLTYTYPPPPDKAMAWRVNGWELTAQAQQFIRENPGNYSPAQLELNLEYEDIWTENSVSKAKMILILNYTLLVISLATAIFCLLEANLKNKPRRASRMKSRNRSVTVNSSTGA